jgi:hypothetical protein
MRLVVSRDTSSLQQQQHTRIVSGMSCYRMIQTLIKLKGADAADGEPRHLLTAAAAASST